MPHKKEFTAVRNIDNVLNAVDQFPLEPGDKRYVDYSSVRGNTLKKIKRMLDRHNIAGKNLHLLFSGYRGNGKTTELYHLQSNISQDYHVIYFDASILDWSNIALSDLLLAIAKLSIEKMTDAGFQLPIELLDNVGSWFFDRVLERSGEIEKRVGAKATVGIPKWVSFITAHVFGKVQMNTADRVIMRRRLDQNMDDLINKVNMLLIEAAKKVKEKSNKELLFIMDSLDRIRQGLDRDLFLKDGNLLKRLNGNFIYVVPISLLYDAQATLLPFDEKLILPMVPIYKKGIDRKENKKGIDHLKKMISNRIVLQDIFKGPVEKMVKELILASGGHLRDLMKLIGYACNLTDDRILSQHVQAAINILMCDYEKIIRDDVYEHIVTTYRTQASPNNEINQELIYNNVILAYNDTDQTEWKDVHPVVIRNNKFQKVLKEV